MKSFFLALLASSLMPMLGAASVSLSDVEAHPTDSETLALPGAVGADILRVTGDWSAVSGLPKSNELELEIVGPDGQTGVIRAFTNAQNDSFPVVGLTGDAVLTSPGTAGDYQFNFETSDNATSANLQNVSVAFEKILEDNEYSGTLGIVATFNRPNVDLVTLSGNLCYFDTYTFTPSFSGTYTIESQQLPFNGFILLYNGIQTTNPAIGDLIAANDDSTVGQPYSRLDVPLTAGQTYTLVTTTVQAARVITYTNRIRFSAPLDGLPAYAPVISLTGQTLSFQVDQTIEIIAEVDGSPTPTQAWFKWEDGAYVSTGQTGTTLTINNARIPDSGEYYLQATNSEGTTAFTLIATVTVADPSELTYEGYAANNGLTEGREGDDNNNGLSNIVEFALQRLPSDPIAPPMDVRQESGRFMCRFYRNRNLLDIEYVIQASRDLITWDTLFDSALTDLPNSDGNFHEVSDTEDIMSRRFVRMSIVY